MKTGTDKKFVHILYSMLLFFILNIPFRLIMHLLPYSEVRPSNMIPPVLGILWGAEGALGTAMANLITDIWISHNPLQIWMPGFWINFLYAYLPYRLWHGGRKRGQQRRLLPQMDSISQVLKYCGIIMLDSVIVTFLLTVTFQAAGQAITVSDVFFLFFNNFDFAILLGIPALIFLSFLKERAHGRKLAMGARAVAGFMILSVFFVTAMAILTYALLKEHSEYDALQRWKYIYRVMGVGIHILFAGTLLFLWYVEKYITKPLAVLTKDMKQFAGADHLQESTAMQGRMSYSQIHTGDELQILAEAFQKMTSDIHRYVRNLAQITAEKERIGAELSVASNIQTDMLPTNFPPFPDRTEFRIYATMYTAKEVGGDFYDFFMVDETHLAVVMADVSGKGVPAALFMVVAKTLIQSQAKQGGTPWEIFYHVNDQLCENNASGMFVTAWMGILDLFTGQMLYSNAGHTRPMLCRAQECFEWFPDAGHGFVLGGMEQMRFPEGTYQFREGDRLFLYTDGVTEANNNRKELFGEVRLCETLNCYKKEPLDIMLSGVKARLDSFADGVEQFDDITMLALIYEGQ